MKPDPNDRSGNLYRLSMMEIKNRTKIIEGILEGKFNLPPVVAFELCHLQMRFICELIALGCLIAHGDIAETKKPKIQSAWHPAEILTQLERLHPSFYPQPGHQIKDPDTGRPKVVQVLKDGYLTKEQLIQTHKECGGILHRGAVKDITTFAPIDFDKIAAWKKSLGRLLAHHQIKLFDQQHELWVIMDTSPAGEVGVWMMGYTRDDDPRGVRIER